MVSKLNNGQKVFSYKTCILDFVYGVYMTLTLSQGIQKYLLV